MRKIKWVFPNLGYVPCSKFHMFNPLSAWSTRLLPDSWNEEGWVYEKWPRGTNTYEIITKLWEISFAKTKKLTFLPVSSYPKRAISVQQSFLDFFNRRIHHRKFNELLTVYTWVLPVYSVTETIWVDETSAVHFKFHPSSHFLFWGINIFACP